MVESLWVISFLVAAGGTAAVGWAKKGKLLDKRRALGRARSAIGRAPEGQVRIEGVASCDRPLLTAPITGRPCIFYDLVVGSAEEGGPALRELRGLELLLDDGTGTARVVFQDTGRGIPLREGPRHLTCVIDRAVLIQGKPTDAQGAKIDALLVEHGLAKRGAKSRKWWTVSEGIIAPGDTVAVAGRGSREIAPRGIATHYRSPPSQYVIRASESAPTTIVKLPG